MAKKKTEAIPRNNQIQVSSLVEQLQQRLSIDVKSCFDSTNWKDHYITEAELHRPGLALAGYVELFTFQRVQVLGNTECQYLAFLTRKEQEEAFEHLIQFDIPVIFLTANNSLPPYLMDMAEENKIPIYKTPLETTAFMYQLRDFLEDQFALQTLIHGSMIDVYGIGIMIMGDSGIGKSEVALDLIERGHRLVADDVVMITKKSNVLLATPTEMNKHFMEIRGLGIIDIMSMFGIRAIRYQKRVEVVLELSLWKEGNDIERTGLNHDFATMLGIEIPRIKLPITPGKNITVIAEVVAMNYLLKHYGYDPAKAFQNKVKKHIARNRQPPSFPKRAVDYFEGDIE